MTMISMWMRSEKALLYQGWRWLDARSAPSVCGDSTKKETYDTLMGDIKANLVIQSP